MSNSRTHKIILTALFALSSACNNGPSGEQKDPNQTGGVGGGSILRVGPGPGFFDQSFETSPTFLKVTAQPLPITQHTKGQGRNADIWYSSNIQQLFGQSSVAAVPEGTVAVKKFTSPENQIMVTAMIKKSGSWQYYMGPETQFPSVPLPAAEALTKCAGCHQSTGSRTDMLPYLAQAVATGNTAINPNVGGASGPGFMDPNFRQNTQQFVKATATPIPTTQHGQGQGRNAEIWYSANLRSAFGQNSLPAAGEGSVAIKQFTDPQNKTVITGMVKAGGQWQYYMGPLNQFPSTPLPAAEAQMCISCHQSIGSQTDFLPYISQARAAF